MLRRVAFLRRLFVGEKNNVLSLKERDLIMKVTAKLFATLRESRGKQLDIEIEEGANVLSVLEKLSIKKTDVTIILVNGNNTGVDALLSEGDTLSLFPPVGGG